MVIVVKKSATAPICFPSCLPPLPCPKSHTTKSQDRKTLLCLDIINNSYLKHAPMFSHFERTRDTRGLTADVFFNTAPPTGSQTDSPFFLSFFFAVICQQDINVRPMCLVLVCHVSCFLAYRSALVCLGLSGVNTRQSHQYFIIQETFSTNKSRVVISCKDAPFASSLISALRDVLHKGSFFFKKKIKYLFFELSLLLPLLFFKYPYICKLRSTLNELWMSGWMWSVHS